MKKGYVMLILFLFFTIILLLGGCFYPEPNAFLEGEVIWISGNLVNGTIMFGNPYFVFGVQTTSGMYTIQLDPTDRGGSSGQQTIYNLAATIKPGIKIKFPTELHGRINTKKDPMGFSKSQVGILDPDDIEILFQKEQ